MYMCVHFQWTAGMVQMECQSSTMDTPSQQKSSFLTSWWPLKSMPLSHLSEWPRAKVTFSYCGCNWQMYGHYIREVLYGLQSHFTLVFRSRQRQPCLFWTKFQQNPKRKSHSKKNTSEINLLFSIAIRSFCPLRTTAASFSRGTWPHTSRRCLETCCWRNQWILQQMGCHHQTSSRRRSSSRSESTCIYLF